MRSLPNWILVACTIQLYSTYKGTSTKSLWNYYGKTDWNLYCMSHHINKQWLNWERNIWNTRNYGILVIIGLGCHNSDGNDSSRKYLLNASQGLEQTRLQHSLLVDSTWGTLPTIHGTIRWTCLGGMNACEGDEPGHDAHCKGWRFGSDYALRICISYRWTIIRCGKSSCSTFREIDGTDIYI